MAGLFAIPGADPERPVVTGVAPGAVLAPAQRSGAVSTAFRRRSVAGGVATIATGRRLHCPNKADTLKPVADAVRPQRTWPTASRDTAFKKTTVSTEKKSFFGNQIECILLFGPGHVVFSF